ncbi:MAG: ComEA family DNA-binding protein [Erysipelotrichaceae bacterium]|nr:ComEA family DNA-binding protein [Erysipelotrichaceae bacterium]MBQ9987982.1 ComEA family DNA-binding protein [Erysipelotrichales bacterium]MBR3694361.1 ComEA family DNA-binding protein [Erysipelotrichales bacterium]
MHTILLLILLITGCTHVEVLPPQDISTITVMIQGSVEKEGEYTLHKGSTLEELLELAKPLDTADLSLYSLSMPLYEGDIIEIREKNTSCISINYASKEELIEIIGIGEKTAQAIIEYRSTYGLFKNINEITNVKGIGEKKLAKMRDQICL